jgi:hypothetical protein
LLSMLLLALAPAVSRVLAAAEPQLTDGWSQMCTRMGLQWQPVAGTAGADTRGSLPGMGAASDCDYCPLAGACPPPEAWQGRLPAPLAGAGVLTRAATTAPRAALWRGLGSRGPPVPA